MSPVGVLTVPIRQLPSRTGCLSLLIIDAIVAGPISLSIVSIFSEGYSRAKLFIDIISVDRVNFSKMPMHAHSEIV